MFLTIDGRAVTWCRALGMTLVTGLVVVGAGASIAFAEDCEDLLKAKALIVELDGLIKQRKYEDATDKVDALATLYEDLSDKKARALVLKRVGKCSRRKNEAIVQCALEAFDVMEDPGAWPYIAPFLKQRDRRAMPSHFEQTMRTVKSLKLEPAIKPLLTLVNKSKHLGVAGLAMETLGAYGESPQRLRILTQLVEVVRKEKPGVKGKNDPAIQGPNRTGDEAVSRWVALGPAMVTAANALTGQEVGSPEAWIALYGRHKRDLKALFES